MIFLKLSYHAHKLSSPHIPDSREAVHMKFRVCAFGEIAPPVWIFYVLWAVCDSIRSELGSGHSLNSTFYFKVCKHLRKGDVTFVWNGSKLHSNVIWAWQDGDRMSHEKKLRRVSRLESGQLSLQPITKFWPVCTIQRQLGIHGMNRSSLRRLSFSSQSAAQESFSVPDWCSPCKLRRDELCHSRGLVQDSCKSSTDPVHDGRQRHRWAKKDKPAKIQPCNGLTVRWVHRPEVNSESPRAIGAASWYFDHGSFREMDEFPVLGFLSGRKSDNRHHYARFRAVLPTFLCDMGKELRSRNSASQNWTSVSVFCAHSFRVLTPINGLDGAILFRRSDPLGARAGRVLARQH